MKFLAARRYKSPRTGQLSQADKATRRLAYSLKNPLSPTRDFETAGCEMAALIETPCWLVPIPSSKGDTRANTILASHIARHRPGAQIAKAIRRTQPIESQCYRHRRNLRAIAPEEHHLRKALRNLPTSHLYFIDNVATSGNTIRAAYTALKHGTGLVFADAGRLATNL